LKSYKSVRKINLNLVRYFFGVIYPSNRSVLNILNCNNFWCRQFCFGKRIF